MLTSLFYYEYYKPYILKADSDTDKRKLITSDARLNVLTLNKILKNEVINYAADISDAVLKIKDSSRKLSLNIQKFNNNIGAQELEILKSLLIDNVEDFADIFNKYTKVLLEQQHSYMLKDFATNISEELFANIERLSLLGLYKNENVLLFNSNKLNADKISMDDIFVSDSINVFNKIYLEAYNILQYPLSEHMNFIPFNFYYNYTFSNSTQNSFKMIQTGMLINTVV